MIAFICICYGGLYFLIFNKLGLLKKSPGNISAFVGVGVAIVAGIVFMWYTFAPMSSDARAFRYIIPIVPNVKGQVVDVPIKPLEPLKAGDTLFQIDPAPYAFSVAQLRAQIDRHKAEKTLADVNVARAQELLKVQAAARVDLDNWIAQRDIAVASIASAQAQLDNAQWQLAETTVKAPAEGHVVNLQLRPGNFVTSVPLASSLAFVVTGTNEVLASYSQSAIRRITVGDAAEVSFNHMPGETLAGTVVRIVEFGAQSQLTASGQLPTLTGAPVTDRWAVVVELDGDNLQAQELPQGAGGTMAVYTQYFPPVQIISRVAIRMAAWMAYLTSP
ncbi:MAG: efflux RND transporter periplasmic adaptor subunit [Pseudomonadota bacterium]